MAYSAEERESKLTEIFKKIENGLSLRKALIEVHIPAVTFYEWIDKDEEKAKQYARACEERAESLVDEMIDIADDSSKDVIEQDLGDGIVNHITNHEVIQRSKLRVDARKWLISKLAPKKYGDKIDVTTGGDKIQSAPSVNLSMLDTETLQKIKAAMAVSKEDGD